MSCLSVEAPLAPVRLLRAAVCGGYFPAMRQPVLRADFAPARASQAPARASQESVLVTDIEGGIAAIIPDFALRELAGSGGDYPLLSLVAGVYEALLGRVGIPLLCSSRMFAECGAEEGAVVFLPILDHSVYAPYLEGLKWAISLINGLLTKRDINPLGPELARVLGQLSAVAPSGMNTRLFIEEADRLDIPWRKLAGNVYRFGIGARSRLFDSSFTDSTSLIGTQLARDKRLTAQVLIASGLPGARHQQAYSGDDAVAIAERFGYPVVVKPANADGGRGVFAGLLKADGVRQAFAQASEVSSQVLVEKHAEGKDYRLQVLHDEVYWISHRVPGGVTGDGVHTVKELLAAVNADPRRGPRGSNSRLKIIELDDEALELLEEAGLNSSSIPQKDQFVRLRRASNVASGGIPVPALEGAHPDNMELAVRAARLLRLDVAGVDLIIPDIRESWLESGALICEVNAQPQLSSTLPAYLIKKLVADGGRVPIIVILGGAPAWARQLEQALNAAGRCVGALWPEGVSVAGRKVLNSPVSVYQGCEAILNDTRVEQVILCLVDDQLTKTGFPVDRFDHLVLAEPGSHQGSVDWEKLRRCAGFLAELCSGKILWDKSCRGWHPVLESLPDGKVQVLNEAELFRDFLKQYDVVSMRQ